MTVHRNPGLLGTLRDVFAARAGVRSARILAAPNFIIAPAVTPGGTSDAFLYLQPLELNGTRTARTRVARAALSLAQAQAVLQLQSLVSQARVNYYALGQAQEQVALARDLLAVAQQIDDAARRQVELGARPGVERVQTAIEVERAQLQVAQAEGEEQAARTAFNGYLGRAPLDPVAPLQSLTAIEQGLTALVGAPGAATVRAEVQAAGADSGTAAKSTTDNAAPRLTPKTGSPTQGVAGNAPAASETNQAGSLSLPADLAAAQRQALAQRGEVGVAAANREVQYRQAELDRAEGRPDLGLQLRAGEIVRGIRDAGIGAVFTIPLDYGTRRERIRQETLAAQADSDRLAGAQGQVRLDVLQSAARAQSALAGLRVYNGSLLTDTRTLLDASRFGFAEGKTTILAVLEAERTYRATAAGRINALINFAQARSNLDRATGTIPPALLAALEADFARPGLNQLTTVNTATVPIPAQASPLPTQTMPQKRGGQ